jgi:hypothetical protein
LHEFVESIQTKHIVWAPDGDEAFGDGSCVLQFDVKDRVRVMTFRCGQDGLHAPETLREEWLSADEFYDILQRWRDAFKAAWESLPKVKDCT